MRCLDPLLTLIATEAKVRVPHVYFCLAVIRDEGWDFHREAVASFAGLEARHLESIVAALQARNIDPLMKEGGGKDRRNGVTRPRKTDTGKASRLQADWRPPEDWLELAMTEKHWSRKDALAEAERMRDWALGKGEAKADWLATWRNWFRNSQRPEGQPPRQASNMSRIETLRMQIKGNRAAGRDMVADQLQAELDRLEDNVVDIRRKA